jgi:hypothetical protein
MRYFTIVTAGEFAFIENTVNAYGKFVGNDGKKFEDFA